MIIIYLTLCQRFLKRRINNMHLYFVKGFLSGVLTTCTCILFVELYCPFSSYEVRFSPHGGCTDLICKKINEARKEILVQAYSFTSDPIASALIKASKRGVSVIVLIDKNSAKDKYCVVQKLHENNLKILIDSKHSIAHNKVMIIDEQYVLTGSFNFTKSAENSNAENCLVIKDLTLASLYKENWNQHLKHSSLYEHSSQ